MAGIYHGQRAQDVRESSGRVPGEFQKSSGARPHANAAHGWVSGQAGQTNARLPQFRRLKTLAAPAVGLGQHAMRAIVMAGYLSAAPSGILAGLSSSRSEAQCGLHTLS